MLTRNNHRAATAALLICLGLVGAGCGAPEAPASQRTAPPPAAANPAGPAATVPSASLPIEIVKVAFAADSAVYAPMFIAVDQGYFAQEGIEIEIVKAGGGVSTPALMSNEIQYSTSAASTLSAMLAGAPLRIVYTNADKTGYELRSTSPEVRSLADVVGKTIGVQSRGDTMELAVRMALQQRGVDPDAVSYVAVGVGSQRLVAMEMGSVAAVVLSVADAAQAADAGLGGQRLVDIQQEVRMSWMGAATNERELQEHPDRVKRFLRATAKGREYFRAFREESIDILTKYNQKPRTTNEIDYDDALNLMTDDGTIPVEVQQRDAQVRAGLNGVAQVPPAEQMYDYSAIREVYQELRASGWKPTR